jgi:hypothetical protein
MPKTAITIIANRRCPTEETSVVLSGSIPKTASCGSADRMASRTCPASAIGSPSVWTKSTPVCIGACA